MDDEIKIGKIRLDGGQKIGLRVKKLDCGQNFEWLIEKLEGKSKHSIVSQKIETLN